MAALGADAVRGGVVIEVSHLHLDDVEVAGLAAPLDRQGLASTVGIGEFFEPSRHRRAVLIGAGGPSVVFGH